MDKLMWNAKFSSLDEMTAMTREAGVKFMACTTTMGVIDVSKEAFIPEVYSPLVWLPSWLRLRRERLTYLFEEAGL